MDSSVLVFAGATPSIYASYILYIKQGVRKNFSHDLKKKKTGAVRIIVKEPKPASPI
jgi:hypothetical protein